MGFYYTLACVIDRDTQQQLHTLTQTLHIYKTAHVSITAQIKH